MSTFRGIFKFEEESETWKQAVKDFPNRIPRFASKVECEKFVSRHANTGSNPDYPNLYHSITTLVSWQQISCHLLPKIREYNLMAVEKNTSSAAAAAAAVSDNASDRVRGTASGASGENGTGEMESRTAYQLEQDGVGEYLESRLNLSVHREMCSESVLNTLKYMFFHMRCGIYVMIRDNKIAIFCPFVNKDYQNSWHGALKIDSADGTALKYYDDKASELQRQVEEAVLEDQSNWWANGNIICNYVTSKSEGDSNQYLGDHFLLQIKDMLSDACNNRIIPDCEFFVNKRDYPHLKFNADIAGGIPVEPYGFIYDRDDKEPSQDLPLTRHLYSTYAPILSYYTSKRFADIPIPSTEDWESACGEVFPASFVSSERTADGTYVPYPSRDLFTAANLKKFETPWSEKVNTAFFRGTATGGGTTPETNQRLHLAMMSYLWTHSEPKFTPDNTAPPRASGSAESESSIPMVPFLDAKITGWNARDKKIASSKMTYIHQRDFPFENKKNLKKNYVPIYKQASYKYLVYVEGHCAACRYGFMMQMGSVILKVKSQCVASEIWYFPLLRPYVDHIPVKADLSDLEEVLKWCHANDDKCAEIAANAQKLYKERVSRNGILDYLQAICEGISERTIRAPAWASAAPSAQDAPSVNMGLSGGGRYCFESETGERCLCSYCKAASQLVQQQSQEDVYKMEAEREASKSEDVKKTDAEKDRKRMLKQRMRDQKAAAEEAAAAEAVKAKKARTG